MQTQARSSSSGADRPDASQVVIVGGGPVGMGLAIELGQRGIGCTVVERHAQPQPLPKGQNLTQRTMEHFHFWGIEKELRAARTVPEEYGIGGMTAYRSLLGEYHHGLTPRELVRPYYFTDNERLPQFATEEVLRRRVRDFPGVEVLYGWSAEGVSQDRDGATVTIVEREGEARRELRADYVVGCDGSRSVIRDGAGITQTKSDHDRLMVLLVFRSQALHGLLERYPGKSFYNVLHPDLEGYWQFFGRVDLGTTWFFHAPVPPDTTKDNFDFTAYLHRAVGAAFDVEMQHVGFWDLRIATADTYRGGRVFVAGDAAHSHPPYGGYGINTGFEDARNLGWKLAAVLKGWAGEALLDAYDAERRPVFATMAHEYIEKQIKADRHLLENFDPERDRGAFEREWNARGQGAKGEVSAFEPHYGASPVIWGEEGDDTSACGRHEFAARPGHHLAPLVLSNGRNVFDVLGEGFTLMAFGADPSEVAAFEAAAAKIGLPLKVVRDEPGEAAARYEARLVLVRPDQFVGWRDGGAKRTPEQVLRRVAGLPAGTEVATETAPGVTA